VVVVELDKAVAVVVLVDLDQHLITQAAAVL
jgi:hypothetical protein